MVEPVVPAYMKQHHVQYMHNQTMNMNQTMHPMSIQTSMGGVPMNNNGRLPMPPPYPGLQHSIPRQMGQPTNLEDPEEQRRQLDQLDIMQRELRKVMGIKEQPGGITSTGASPASSANSPPSYEASPR